MSGALLLSLILLHVCYRATMAAFAGPYWLSIRQFLDCPSDEMDVPRKDMRSSALFRYNRTTKTPVMDLNMTLTNRVFFRGESKMTLDIARWDTVSGWRKHFLVMALGELCFVYEDVVTDIVQCIASIAGVSTRCPVPDGTYGGENAAVQIASLRHFPSLPYGRYKVHVIVGFMKSSRPKEPRSCLQVVADVIPK